MQVLCSENSTMASYWWMRSISPWAPTRALGFHEAISFITSPKSPFGLKLLDNIRSLFLWKGNRRVIRCRSHLRRNTQVHLLKEEQDPHHIKDLQRILRTNLQFDALNLLEVIRVITTNGQKSVLLTDISIFWLRRRDVEMLLSFVLLLKCAELLQCRQ